MSLTSILVRKVYLPVFFPITQWFNRLVKIFNPSYHWVNPHDVFPGNNVPSKYMPLGSMILTQDNGLHLVTRYGARKVSRINAEAILARVQRLKVAFGLVTLISVVLIGALSVSLVVVLAQ